MKWREQLKILLWKNWTLKKRNVGLTFMEILIPLLLFIIMLVLRLQVPVEPKDSVFHEARPLPSAGFVPVLQTFCRNVSGSRNPDSFRDQTGSVIDTIFTITKLISDVLLPDQHASGETSNDWMRILTKFKNDPSSLLKKHKTKGRLDLVSLWEKHSANIEDMLHEAEHIFTQSKHTAADILQKVEYLSDLAERRDRESPVPFAEGENPLPEVCAKYVNKTRPPSIYRNNYYDLSTSAPSEDEAENNKTRDMLAELETLWRTTEAIVCATPSPPPTAYSFGESFSGTIDDIPIADIIMRTLSNNPKVLYGPTETEADRIIDNMFETLGVLDDITELATEWLRLSERIRKQLNETFRPSFVKHGDPFSEFITSFMAASPTNLPTAGHEGTLEDIQGAAESSTRSISGSTSSGSASSSAGSNRPTTTTTNTPTTSAPTPTPTTTLRVSRPTTRDRDVITTIILRVVNTLDWVACRWLQQGQDINMRDLFKGFRTEEDMVDYFLHQAKEDGVAVLSSIFFNVNEDGTLPEHMVYKIRQNATVSQSTRLVKDLIYEPGPDWKVQLYYINGFVWLQDLAERSIINVYTKGKNDSVVEPGIYIEEFPTTCYRKDEISLVIIEHMVPLIMMLSWVFPVAMLVRGIVYEKELRLKEMMKLMGLERSVHWVGWFIVSFLQMTITMTFLTIAFSLFKLVPYTSFFLLWFILLKYGLSAIIFAFFVSLFFSNAKIAAACSGIIWMLTYVPYMFIAILENGGQAQPFELKTAMSFFSTTGLGLGAKYLNFYESTGEGVQFSNVGNSPVSGDNYSILVGIIMSLIADAVYIILLWYIDNVMPGDYGVPSPWYFPFTRTYWCGRPNPTKPSGYFARTPSWLQDTLVTLGFYSAGTVAEQMVQQMKQMQEEQSAIIEKYFEPPPDDLPETVVMNNLTKIYPNGKLAVSDVTLSLYEGQILSFLGHNGAGKTTTMSILTGMIPSTSGSAFIYGKNIQREINEIRKNLGMCPQHNVLFDSMTVEEHLRFYCRLKGAARVSIDLEIESMLSDSGLREKRDTRVEALSGGMKRKLSIGIAFIAGSRTVILDEPTAGVDPWSRREIWDLILKFKKNRTIMLSTHHMDEADILGDRIAVISHGQMKCVGSSLFLKSTFGEGYHLIVAKKMLKMSSPTEVGLVRGLSIVEPASAAELKESAQILTRCSEFKVTRAIQIHVSSAYLRAETPRELHYILPFLEIRKGACGPLFDYLDKSLHSLDIDSYGVSDTSLEEVFLCVTMEEKIRRGEANATYDDAETGFNEQYQSFESIGKKSQNGSIRSLPSRLRRSLRGNKRKRAYEQKDEALQRTDGFMVEDSDGRIYTPDPVRRQQNVEGARIRSNSTSSVVMSHTEKGHVNAAFHRSNSDEGFPVRDDQELVEEEIRRARQKHFADTQTVENNTGAGTYVVTGFSFFLYQFQTCMYKKVVFTVRNWKALVSQIILPVVFVTLAMFVGVIGGPRVQDEPPLDMSTSQYYNVSKGLGEHYVPYGDSGGYSWSYDASASALMESFDLPSGIGSTCILDDKRWGSSNRTYAPGCDTVRAPTFHTEGYIQEMASSSDRYYPRCSCQADKRNMKCEKGGYTLPPELRVVTSDILQNISSPHNLTEFLYSTSEQYRMSRFGALGFGYSRPHVPSWIVNVPFLEHIYISKVAKAMYNSKGWHSMPTFINALNNAVLRANLPRSRGNPAAYGISVISHPMNGTSSVNAAGSLIFGAEFIIAIMILAGFAFIPAGFVLFLVQERATKAKHLQFVSGLNPLIYWLSNIIWDMLLYLLPATFCCIIFKVFGVKAFSSDTNYPAVVVLVLVFGWSCTPVLYPASFLFKEASAAYVFLAVFNILIGVSCLFITFLLDYFRREELTRVSEVLKSVFVIFPTFSLGRGLMDIVLTNTANEVNELIGRPERFHPFDWKVTGRNNVALVGVGLFCYILTILIEYKFFVKPRVVPVQSIAPVDGEDDDVAAERQRVLNSPNSNDVIRLENLTKIYRSRGLQAKHLAVHRLCLGVPKGECFGMLGVNGAGKTTTFKMLTGDHPPTGGDAYLCGYSILKGLNKARRNMGYCPQFDALFDELTARQHLTIYAQLRGVPRNEVSSVVDWALDKLELRQYADRAAGTYSGGNKRKLSTAIALLGNPQIIFLDEPTAGMDPYAKRFLWNLILSLISDGKSIVFTSHSMEECETLCTRLAIMVAGRFRCLGSVQHLKSRYGGGYGLKLTVKGPNYDKSTKKVMQYLTVNMPLATFKERHHNMIEYEFTAAQYSLSTVFNKMREISSHMPVEEYSLSQHTLDNVFIDFVKEQAALSESELSHEDPAPTWAADDRQNDVHGITNPLAENLRWLENIDPEEYKKVLEDTLVALTRRLDSEGGNLEDAATWNTILALLKGNKVPVSNDDGQMVSREDDEEIRVVDIEYTDA